MILKFDKEKLDGILTDYSRITGISIALINKDAEQIASSHGEDGFCRMLQQEDDCLRCRLSDGEILGRCRRSGKPEMHICHAGLCDMAIPLMADGSVMAYVILGRIRRSDKFDESKANVEWFSGSREELRKEYEKLPYYNEESIKSVANIAVAISAYILGDGVIRPKYNIVAEKAAKLIEENLSEKLSVGFLCKSLGVSKNSLYESFKTAFGCTIKDYVTDKRVARAMRLLCETEMTVGEIADSVGIYNHTYFSRLMSERTGLSPMKFRKNNENK